MVGSFISPLLSDWGYHIMEQGLPTCYFRTLIISELDSGGNLRWNTIWKGQQELIEAVIIQTSSFVVEVLFKVTFYVKILW